MLFSAWQATTHALQPVQADEVDRHAPTAGPGTATRGRATAARAGGRARPAGGGSPDRRCAVTAAFSAARLECGLNEVRDCGRTRAAVVCWTGSRPSMAWCAWVQASVTRSPVLHDLQPAAEPGRVGRSQSIGVESDARADLSGPRRPWPRWTVTAPRRARQDERRRPHRPALDTAARPRRCRGRRAGRRAAVGPGGCPAPCAVAGLMKRRIAPGQLGDRLGQFLKPAVVGEPAVVRARVGAELNLQPVCPATGGAVLRPSRPSASPRVAAAAVVRNDPLLDGRSQDASKSAGLPRAFRQCSRTSSRPRCSVPVSEPRDQLDRRAAAVERLDQRLLDRGGAVVARGRRPRIPGSAPRAGATRTRPPSRRGRGRGGPRASLS